MGEHYNHPPEGPEDITPADDVYRIGDTVRIEHGPGSVTEVDADEFYGTVDADDDDGRNNANQGS